MQGQPANNSGNENLVATFDQLAGVLSGLQEVISKVSGDSGSSKAKVHDPDVFDGSDPRKLQSFLVALSLVFADCPAYFTKEKKVSYTLSYLGGTAKEWFEPDILDPDPNDPPAWMSSFKYLVQELTENFGMYDMEGDAEERLGALRMRENDQVRKYIIRFNTLAAATNWDATALAWAFKRGLASRIKDKLARVSPEPITLSELRREVQRIDNRYWRREEEWKREAARASAQQSKKDGKKPANSSLSNQQSSSSKPNTPNQSANNQNRSGGSSSNKMLRSCQLVGEISAIIRINRAISEEGFGL